MLEYAPVVVFVYNRPNHTEELLDSLAKCRHADKTDVFVFADGPKNEAARENVSNVRSIIRKYEGTSQFSKYSIYESEINKGLAKSVISGVSEIISKYGRVVVLEDDLVVAPQFLDFMNGALEAYEKDETKFAIAGWSYPLNELKKYDKDAWLFYRACSWGWGTWGNRWNKVVWDHDKAGFEEKLKNPVWVDKFCRGGNDLPNMLKMQLEGKIDSWAVRWNAWAAELNMLTVYPKDAFVVNNGRDGSGVHSHEGQSDSSASLRNDDFSGISFASPKDEYLFDEIVFDKKLADRAWLYESDTLTKKIKRNLRTIFVEHRVPNVVRRIHRVK